MPVIILHYHELFLKGSNRNFFVTRLRRAARQALEGLPARIAHEDHRMLVIIEDEARAAEAVERLQKVPGVAYLAAAAECEPALEAIVELGARRMAVEPFRTFRVRASRGQKTFPFRSSDIERQLGARINRDAKEAGREVRVDLENAEVTCWVEVTHQRALVYTRKIPGPGGLPAGSSGRLVCLLSGGFDSAVAAYKVMRRGVRVTFVHFYGVATRAGEDSPPIARELVERLTPYQGRSRLYLVPFAEIQRQIVAHAPESCRVLLYRRMMLRIAEKLAYRARAQGLITGDSLAQVASQTVQNLRAVEAAVEMPVYRPLIGDDKQEILDLARRIGTYDISAEPFTDCCSLFQPRKPKIFSTAGELDEAESGLDVRELTARGVSGSKKEIYVYEGGKVQRRREKAATEPAQAPAALGR